MILEAFLHVFSNPSTFADLVLALDANGVSPNTDLLAQLLELNISVAARIESGQPVTAPGVLPDYPEPARLITSKALTSRFFEPKFKKPG
jgi:hypothetical protein